MLIAAYAEFWVRSINLLDARLNNQPMDKPPLPGAALRLLYQKYGPAAPISAAQMATGGGLLPLDLEWQLMSRPSKVNVRRLAGATGQPWDWRTVHCRG